ncbi:MAG: HAD-IIIA family hydrolase [Candidatus Omnitrophica bacterium]|nr:HAD-IIIA family hydrolase [Candidatus Omnitrophota bacterium]
MKNKLKDIKVLAMDVDGVLTDGRIIYDGLGRELKFFDVQDGCGINRARKAGLKTAVISARSCRAVKARTTDLKIDAVYLDAYPKLGAYEKMLKKFGVTDSAVCFIGDDLPDIAILKRVGLAVAVANACADVKAQADLVTRKPGGRGAVREVAEMILKAQGKWQPE